MDKKLIDEGLNKIIKETLLKFADDYRNAKDNEARDLADKATYEFVDNIHFEDIYLREVYINFYEQQKKEPI